MDFAVTSDTAPFAPIAPLNEIKPSFFIINGTKATNLENFPTRLLSFTGETKRPFCTGVIVSNRVVLTAGHWLRHLEDPEDVFVRVGSVKYKSGIMYDIESFKEHKKREGPINNIGLLVTTDEIEFGSNIGPIKLPKKERNYDNVNTTILGWGRITDSKKKPTGSCTRPRAVCPRTNAKSTTSACCAFIATVRRRATAIPVARLFIIVATASTNCPLLFQVSSTPVCSSNPRGGIFTTKVYPLRRWVKKTMEEYGFALNDGDDGFDDDVNNVLQYPHIVDEL